MNSNQPRAVDLTSNDLQGILPDLEAFLHSHPELSMHEVRTAGLAADRLRNAGYEVTTGIGRTGVVAVLRNGDGPTVMLRADMDALPVEEATGLPYASKVTAADVEGKTVPVSHMCGHDMHVTWLAGATRLLAAARSRQRWGNQSRPSDRLGAAGGDRRLALCGRFIAGRRFYFLVPVRHSATQQSGAPVRRGWTGALCGCRYAKGARLRPQTRRGGASWNADGNRRGDDA
jgi:hypothetical protein